MRKYYKEDLQHLKGCKSIREALGKLGLSPDGGHKGLRSILKEILFESENYLGKSIHKNTKRPRLRDEQFFTENSTRKTVAVRDALFRRGTKA